MAKRDESAAGEVHDVLAANGRTPRSTRDVRVDPAQHPGCLNGTERLPSPGERVYTTEGPAVVVRILGRTGSSGRLLELAIEDGRKPAFFAAAANVMVEAVGQPVARVE